MNHPFLLVESLLSAEIKFPIIYEDLIRDTDLVLFRRIFEFLGHPEGRLDRLCQIAWEKSLFSEQVNQPRHVSSGVLRAVWRTERAATASAGRSSARRERAR